MTKIYKLTHYPRYNEMNAIMNLCPGAVITRNWNSPLEQAVGPWLLKINQPCAVTELLLMVAVGDLLE